MKRNHRDAVMRLMFPSLFLWIIAYFTLFIRVDDFTNRNRICITLLLALITLFGSVSMREDFPTTTYFKYVDIWFMWYLWNLFMIISVHILLAMCVDSATKDGIKVRPLSMEYDMGEEALKEQAMSKIKCINRAAQIVFPGVMVIFNYVYFCMTT